MQFPRLETIDRAPCAVNFEPAFIQQSAIKLGEDEAELFSPLPSPNLPFAALSRTLPCNGNFHKLSAVVVNRSM